MTPATANHAAICQICGGLVRDDKPSRTCAGCQALFHDECWSYVGGCATYGCAHMYETKKEEAGPVAYWGATQKTCPMCAEVIAIGELTCPYCRTVFRDIKPMSRDDMLRRDEEEPDPWRKTALRMLILSALGLPSPFILIGGGIWYRVHRRDIAQRSPSARALVRIALAVSAVYLILIGLGVAAFWLMQVSLGEQQ